MPSLESWSLGWVIGGFAAATVVIAVFGTMMTSKADALADATGMGEALFGAIFLGATTSLPGLITSVTTAAENHPELAISNAIGGITAQTAFLAIADITYPRVNLEHAAASLSNMMQTALLMILLSIPLVAMAAPPVIFFGVHPASVILFITYIWGFRLIARAKREPMWTATRTPETRQDEGENANKKQSKGSSKLWITFFSFAAVVGAAGYAIAQTGIEIAARTGLSETVVGGFMTAVATSLPELVVSLAAVRQRALTLAVGNIIGGNSFDILFLSGADIAYREGSLYAQINNRHVTLIVVTIIMTSVLLLGLLRREKSGIGNIGFESALVIALYLFSLVVVVFL